MVHDCVGLTPLPAPAPQVFAVWSSRILLRASKPFTQEYGNKSFIRFENLRFKYHISDSKIFCPTAPLNNGPMCLSLSF